MKEPKRAQISSEFFIFIGMAFLISIAFALSSLDQIKSFRDRKESESVKDLALKVQKEILVAASVEDGYVRLFRLPDNLDAANYSLTTQNSTITVESRNSLYIVSIPKVVGNISKGNNIINKTGGVIYLNSVSSTFTDISICRNAQDNGLCSGLDLVYGDGYQAACCSEHSLCC